MTKLALLLSVCISPLSGFVYLRLTGPGIKLQILQNWVGGGQGKGELGGAPTPSSTIFNANTDTCIKFNNK